MLIVQAVPRSGADIHKLLRARIRTANTWEWANKKRTRLRHVQRRRGGFIQVESALGVLVATVRPSTPDDLFYLAEKFMGRLLAWFADDLASIQAQLVPDPVRRAGKKRR